MAKGTESTLKLSKVFGYQQAVKGSLGFSKTYGLTSITGKKGIHYKLGSNQQAFTSIPEENKITAVGFGADDLLIIASKGKRGAIAVFNFRNNDKKILPVAEKIISDSFVWVSFSENNERIGAQGGSPDWGFALWLWETRRLEIVFHPFRMEPGSKVYKFAFNPSDSRYIAAVGKHFLRCYFFKGEQRIQETALHEQERSNQTFHSAAWIPNSRLVMVGTSGGNILVLENMHLVRQVSITEELTRFQSSPNFDDQNVSCIVLTSDGFLCSHGTSSVLWFEENFKLHKVLSDEFNAGHPKLVAVPETIDAVCELIKKDRHVTYREIRVSSYISLTSIVKVLREYLAVKNLFSLNPANLTNSQKEAHVDWCKEMSI
ncbi:cilia-and flagella-associated protein 57 [Trichonephila inaurata madagascariensis]|uniref:Cilia-and flagella-associated protein 57 n=1 Tax=Trichonephila inaurata madagascariensis TaxID=2747483 RepID=A0A8X6YQV3_9ARAC|nr:cilia-and flagella-associated protein 57 [Trichonephila inaurata madagascariensis]